MGGPRRNWQNAWTFPDSLYPMGEWSLNPGSGTHCRYEPAVRSYYDYLLKDEMEETEFADGMTPEITEGKVITVEEANTFLEATKNMLPTLLRQYPYVCSLLLYCCGCWEWQVPKEELSQKMLREESVLSYCY